MAASPTSAWSPLRHALFRNVWIATVVSNIGTWMQDVGAGWLMTTLAPEPMMVALVQTASALPAMLLVLPAGAVADIVDRRRYLIATQFFMFAVSMVLGVLTLLDIANAWTLLAFTFALGVGSALAAPASAALTPELVPGSELQAAIALNSIGVNVSRSVGPAIAGGIVAVTGPWAVFMLNAMSFCGVIMALLAWRRERRRSTLPAERFFGALRTGLRFTRHTPALQMVLVRSFAFLVFAAATWSLLPLIVRQELESGPEVYGVLLACIGIGAVACALFLPRLRNAFTPDQLVAGGSVFYAAAMLVLAYVRDVYLLMLAMFMTGAAWISVLSCLNAAAQTVLPAWVRSRGLALFMVGYMGSMAIGGVLWGHVATVTSIPLALTAAAVGALIGAALTWTFKLGAHETTEIAPSMHWPAPVLSIDPEPDRGPIMVTVEYHINPGDAPEFVVAAHELEQIRRRSGAFAWGIFEDMGVPGRYIEYFMSESWLDHLRQHERLTIADRLTEEKAQAFQCGDTRPKVSHLVLARPAG